MLEKLDIKDYENKQQLVWFGIINKLNELVDAVNELQESQNTYWTDIAEIKKELQHDNSGKANCQENVQDKFAEQRKWIGKLCRFWDDNEKEWVIDFLRAVAYGYADTPYRGNKDWYEHCEPVKPDDPIIYKGEKCETPAENVQQNYVTTSYMTDGHTKEYYGQNGASIVTDHPLPAGYMITIKEK